MNHSRRSLAVLLSLTVALPALAQQPSPAAPVASASPPAASSAAPSADAAAARLLFTKGTELLAAGDVEGALLRFQDSRARFRSFANTANAAVCLEKLGRLDEALDMYRELVADFSAKFTDQERSDIAGIMGNLRRKLASLDVSANVDGTLVVDGRIRGRLPLFGPVSLLPGRHRVLVLKEGYGSAEAQIELGAGASQNVELQLERLSSVGQLAVEEDSGAAGLEVLIDGAPVGLTPWKGTLRDGPHLVALRGQDTGTAPQLVTVVVGQQLQRALHAEPLGPEISLHPQPRTAALAIDGVPLGAGTWVGRLPRKSHQIRASEEGYFEANLDLNPTLPGPQDILLTINRSHPRWPREPSGAFTIGALAQVGLATSLGSDVERRCDLRCSGALPTLLSGGLRGGYAFLSGWTVEATFAAATMQRRGSRASEDGDHTFEAHDALSIRGYQALLGGGYRFRVSERVELIPRLAVGVGFYRSRNVAQVDAVVGADRAAMTVDQSGASVSSNPLLIHPSIEAQFAVGSWRLQGGLALPIIAGSGPLLPNGEAAITPIPTSCTKDQAVCSSGTTSFAHERAYQTAFFLAPTLGAAYQF